MNKYDVVYRRYSDDILLICPPTLNLQTQSMVEKWIGELRLNISRDKTVIAKFRMNSDGVLKSDKPIQYLGFEFDGTHSYIRSGTIAKFQRRVKLEVRRAKQIAYFSNNGNGRGVIYKRNIYRKFSHLGKNNFIGYLERAEYKMKSSSIKKQKKKSWALLTKTISKPLQIGSKGQVIGAGISGGVIE